MTTETEGNLVAPRGSIELSEVQSESLVDVLYLVAKDQLPAEERRTTLLMGKASALLTSSGLSLTVAFTFGGLLLQRTELHQFWPLALYVAALAAGLGAAASATAAMWIGESFAVSQEDVLNPQALAVAESHDLGGSVQGSEQGAKPPVAPTRVGTTAYKRFLIEHYWKIYRGNTKRTSRSAKWIKRGQGLYIAFLCLVLAAGGLLAWDASRLGN